MSDENNISNENTVIPKKRGRKPKSQTLNSNEIKPEVEKIPKKRGRKPKNKSQEEEVEKIPKKEVENLKKKYILSKNYQKHFMKKIKMKH